MPFIYKKGELGIRCKVAEIKSVVDFVEATMDLSSEYGTAQDVASLLDQVRREYRIPSFVEIALSTPGSERAYWLRHPNTGRDLYFRVIRSAPIKELFDFMVRANIWGFHVPSELFPKEETYEYQGQELRIVPDSNFARRYKSTSTRRVRKTKSVKAELAPNKKLVRDLCFEAYTCLNAALPGPAVLSSKYDTSQYEQSHSAEVRQLSSLMYAALDIPGAITKLRNSKKFKLMYADFATRLDMAKVRQVYLSNYNYAVAGAEWNSDYVFEKIHIKLFRRSITGRYEKYKNKSKRS